jgi:hypothetical protein
MALSENAEAALQKAAAICADIKVTRMLKFMRAGLPMLQVVGKDNFKKEFKLSTHEGRDRLFEILKEQQGWNKS